MYSALCNGGGPLNGQPVYGESTPPTSFVYVDEANDWMWKYEVSEIWVGEGEDREFRGYRFDCEDDQGEPAGDTPDGYERRT